MKKTMELDRRAFGAALGATLLMPGAVTAQDVLRLPAILESADPAR